MTENLGYCCINVTLGRDKISVNNSCVKRTFETKGLEYVSQLALKNAINLKQIVEWNIKNSIRVYRMSSDMFPWCSEYEISELPNFDKIKFALQEVGNLALKHNQRLSFHPGPFNVLGSPNEILVTKTIKEMNQHAEIMDIMGLPASYQYPINIHCNGVYGSKIDTLARWVNNHQKLSDSAKKRLVVENDDKASMYSVQDLYDHIFLKIRVPITFDYHHHRFNDGGLSEESAFKLAASTWQYHNIIPLFHYSSAKKTFEDNSVKAQAHADYVYEKINTYDIDVDIEIEAKAKELAVLKYRKTFNELLTEYISLN